jgi:hypothetical protein
MSLYIVPVQYLSYLQVQTQNITILNLSQALIKP